MYGSSGSGANRPVPLHRPRAPTETGLETARHMLNSNTCVLLNPTTGPALLRSYVLSVGNHPAPPLTSAAATAGAAGGWEGNVLMNHSSLALGVIPGYECRTGGGTGGGERRQQPQPSPRGAAGGEGGHASWVRGSLLQQLIHRMQVCAREGGISARCQRRVRSPWALATRLCITLQLQHTDAPCCPHRVLRCHAGCATARALVCKAKLARS